MRRQSYGEADTRANLISPMLKGRGWRAEFILREETDPPIEFAPDGTARRGPKKQADYLLSVTVSDKRQPVPVALIEAKKESKPPAAGMEQAKEYARKCPRFNVPFLYATNGHLFVEFDRSTGKFSGPSPLKQFPTPDELRARYESVRGFSLEEKAAAPLLFPYSGKGHDPRYYQDAAIRAVMEKLATDAKNGQPSRALLSLATGAGKTFIAANLLRRIAQAGNLTRALFLCDRTALRKQARDEFQKEFGDDAAMVEQTPDGRNRAKNARIHIATYQTLGVDDNGDGAAYHRMYPETDCFSHIVIDECHRSAWDKWFIPLRQNPNAAHIGLTATPRQFKQPARARRSVKIRAEFQKDKGITANNLRYFGNPVYEYSLYDGVEDGYLAACRAGFLRANLDIRGLSKTEVAATRPADADTGEIVPEEDIAEKYPAPTYETQILLPERVREMCADLFRRIIESDPERGPDQKTIIFCASIEHAGRVAREMQNLRAEWAEKRGTRPPENYAFECVGETDGAGKIDDFRASRDNFLVAATVDLLTTGVDVPPVRNIAFFRYLKSPIAFRQMLGRGTRIHRATDKLAFCVYDYTGVFELLGGDADIANPPAKKSEKQRETDESAHARRIVSEGYEVWVNELASAILVRDDKGERWMPLHEYRQALADKMLKSIRTQDEFRQIWTVRARRRELLNALATAGLRPAAAMQMEGCEEQDLFDYLNELAWSADPMTRKQRADRFREKNAEWLGGLGVDAAKVVCAIIAMFEAGGTDQLESAALFDSPEVAEAGGRRALEMAGNPAQTMNEMKRRLFAS